jgi:hypothetical protein
VRFPGTETTKRVPLPTDPRGRRAFEARVRRALCAVECPVHGVRAATVAFVWKDNRSRPRDVRVDVKTDPAPCCEKHDRAMQAAFYRAAQGDNPS